MLRTRIGAKHIYIQSVTSNVLRTRQMANIYQQNWNHKVMLQPLGNTDPQ